MEYKKTNIFEVFLVSSIILIPGIEYFNILFNGLRTVFALIFLWIVIFLLPNKPWKAFSKYQLPMMFLLLFLSFAFLHFVFNYYNDYGIQQLINFSNYFFLLLIALYYADSSRLKTRENIMYVILAVLSFQAIISVPYLLNSDPLLIRKLSSGELNLDQRFEAIRNGVGTNALYSSIPPFLVYCYSIIQSSNKTTYKKWFWYLSMIPLCFSVFISTFFASVAVLIVSIILYQILCAEKNILYSIFKFLGIGALLIWIIIILISKFDAFGFIINKFERFSAAGGDDTGRVDLANISLNTFLENPLWGIGVPPKHTYDKIGDHMPWVDLLASYGLLTFSFLLLFFLFFLWRLLSQRKQMKFNKIYWATVVGAIMFILVNFISPMMLNPLSYGLYIMFYLVYGNYDKENQ